MSATNGTHPSASSADEAIDLLYRLVSRPRRRRRPVPKQCSA